MLTDPVADMLTRIRNANKALHDRVEMPSSKLKEEIARILKEEGYVRDYHVEPAGELPYKVLVVELKYGRGRERVLTGLKRISKPGRRIYAGKDRLPRVLGGMGPAILPPSRGGITSRRAERGGRGGEVICFVWYPDVSDRKTPHRCTRRRDRHGRPGPRHGARPQGRAAPAGADA